MTSVEIFYLNSSLPELSSNEPLGIKDGVSWIDGHLILGRVSNQPLGVGEGHIAGGCSVPLIIGDDLHLSVLEDCSTGVGGAEINPHRGRFLLLLSCHFTFAH